ncbi:unnamed protein product [Penicillium nalgiovense]|uniref:very-long-chain enoyl-CoA reductase n=1 Tax=Penicillium nalgiovense TaxID=60175 RepID=A0A9W4I8A9_PENNA|nr:unnamed protein product [Penicillium nalgiovense]CAG7947168.1 unnamed protein product [Penicillium nalgiovense]CAG7971895.1 unnamed protein product [Penicillium nalgiovense]CAG7988813.1 unnamed protein product [Penicillium nalgiovense]CAG8009431.1 unnamed protein product [Penicillium nalgiovense]
MAADKITLVVQPRGKPIRKLPKEIEIPLNASSEELHTALSAVSGCSIHRMRITKGSDHGVVPNSINTTIEDTGMRNSSVIYVKDLGPQIAWRTVFIIEYLGPLLIPALFLFPLRPILYFTYDKPLPSPSDLQLLVCALLSVHFLKREFETIFVHRFSSATMPARNIFKNSAHYWILAGFNIAYWVFHPDAAASSSTPNQTLVYAGLALFVFGELANLNAHYILRNLRRPGTTERGIPSGFGFSVVTCPNYFFEILAWLGIFLVSQLNWSVLLFILVGGLQMWSWAWKKEKRYRKEFGDKYKKKRAVIFPGLA